jgi:hypothetical protein
MVEQNASEEPLGHANYCLDVPIVVCTFTTLQGWKIRLPLDLCASFELSELKSKATLLQGMISNGKGAETCKSTRTGVCAFQTKN